MEFLKEDFEEEEALLADRRMGVYAVVVIWSILLALFLIFACSQAKAEEYTDNQIADAIRKAEGTWTYGIKTVSCKTEAECRKVCLRTINNNKQRYAKYGHLKYSDYLSFLATRYAPINAGNDPKGLNKNWLKNVRYFLSKSK